MPYNLLCNVSLRLYRYSGYCCRYYKYAVSKFKIAYIRNRSRIRAIVIAIATSRISI